MTAVTALTAQNSCGVTAIQKIQAKFISKQIETILDDIRPQGVKIGMLLTGAAVKAVAFSLKRHGISEVVLDPLLKASTGKRLLEPDALNLFKEVLLPKARIVTPNLSEAEILTGRPVRDLTAMKEAAKRSKELGPARN